MAGQKSTSPLSLLSTTFRVTDPQPGLWCAAGAASLQNGLEFGLTPWRI